MISDQVKKNIKAELKKKNKRINTICAELGKDRGHINKITDRTRLNKINDIANKIPCPLKDLFNNI
ncbi:hypothetical protein J2810_004562 [Chryseobacterium rhizosphaerae]|uniref:hypothetical protein n=1 Tax=Chryseobacterium rhizosphaerae TaxID=395937 RepID=UPI00285897D9|nr:hypothetical protein [Chryseobacterium rhizosphaerae]MDR6548472.1 hypothetical protein [Chryseobacterium rhizosphaerae]